MDRLGFFPAGTGKDDFFWFVMEAAKRHFVPPLHVSCEQQSIPGSGQIFWLYSSQPSSRVITLAFV
jgi:hypothetical protein